MMLSTRTSLRNIRPRKDCSVEATEREEEEAMSSSKVSSRSLQPKFFEAKKRGNLLTGGKLFRATASSREAIKKLESEETRATVAKQDPSASVQPVKVGKYNLNPFRTFLKRKGNFSVIRDTIVISRINHRRKNSALEEEMSSLKKELSYRRDSLRVEHKKEFGGWISSGTSNAGARADHPTEFSRFGQKTSNSNLMIPVHLIRVSSKKSLETSHINQETSSTHQALKEKHMKIFTSKERDIIKSLEGIQAKRENKFSLGSLMGVSNSLKSELHVSTKHSTFA